VTTYGTHPFARGLRLLDRPFCPVVLLALLFLFLTPGFGFAQDDPLVRPLRAERMLRSDAVEEQTEAAPGDLGVPFSAVIRDPQPPFENMFRGVRAAGDINTKVGPGAAEFDANFFRGVRLGTPLSHGVRPETSEIKLGNLYIDIRDIRGEALYSDNVNLVTAPRKDGVLAALVLDVGVAYQLGDRFRLGVRGAVIYLPLRNKLGIAGFGVDDLLAEFDLTPLAQAQVGYDLYLSQWHIEFIDNFSVWHRRFGDETDFEIFEGAEFDEEEGVGRYRLNLPRFFGRSGGKDRRDDDLGSDLIEMRNTVGAIASRMLPTVTLMELGAFHENRWYQNRRGESLPNARDTLFANLVSERETMRFKPFLHYRATTYDGQNGWDHRIRGGVKGPVTDYIGFYGDAGYFWSDRSVKDAFLGRVRLEHNPTPFLYHQIQYSRIVTEPDTDLGEIWSYRLRYRVSENLRMELVGLHAHFEDLDRTNSGSDEWRAGVLFTYHASSRATIRTGSVYSRFRHDNSRAPDTETWTTRFELLYSHSETLDSRLVYRHRIRDSSQVLGSYYENLILYSLTKYF
jgi:hypothetical protein